MIEKRNPKKPTGRAKPACDRAVFLGRPRIPRRVIVGDDHRGRPALYRRRKNLARMDQALRQSAYRNNLPFEYAVRRVQIERGEAFPRGTPKIRETTPDIERSRKRLPGR